jgi:nucleotide-binding universal stress UspA family protein
MAPVSILAPLTGSKEDTIVLSTAFAAGKPFGAHVRALFIHPDVREAIPLTELPLSPDLVQDLIDIQQRAEKAARIVARAAFDATARDFGATVTATAARQEKLSASFREVTGHESRTLEPYLMFADLVVFPPLSHPGHPEAHEAFIRLLTKSGKPVLLSPSVAPAELGRKIAIGWDGGSVAAHALCAAMPYLEKADSVELLIVRGTNDDIDVSDVTDYLALHGVEANRHLIAKTARPTGEALLAAADKDGCDLLVVGGYGHSRLAESVFGGATEHFVSHPALPIFMMH